MCDKQLAVRFPGCLIRFARDVALVCACCRFASGRTNSANKRTYCAVIETAVHVNIENGHILFGATGRAYKTQRRFLFRFPWKRRQFCDNTHSFHRDKPISVSCQKRKHFLSGTRVLCELVLGMSVVQLGDIPPKPTSQRSLDFTCNLCRTRLRFNVDEMSDVRDNWSLDCYECSFRCPVCDTYQDRKYRREMEGCRSSTLKQRGHWRQYIVLKNAHAKQQKKRMVELCVAFGHIFPSLVIDLLFEEEYNAMMPSNNEVFVWPIWRRATFTSKVASLVRARFCSAKQTCTKLRNSAANSISYQGNDHQCTCKKCRIRLVYNLSARFYPYRR